MLVLSARGICRRSAGNVQRHHVRIRVACRLWQRTRHLAVATDIDQHREQLRATLTQLPSAKVNTESAIFANANLNLKYMKAYGFDYDYTLAQYKPAIKTLIYELAKQQLLGRLNYPEELATFSYDSTFPIRGLHYDRKTGLLLKLDAFRNIQVRALCCTCTTRCVPPRYCASIHCAEIRRRPGTRVRTGATRRRRAVCTVVGGH